MVLAHKEEYLHNRQGADDRPGAGARRGITEFAPELWTDPPSDHRVYRDIRFSPTKHPTNSCGRPVQCRRTAKHASRRSISIDPEALKLPAACICPPDRARRHSQAYCRAPMASCGKSWRPEAQIALWRAVGRARRCGCRRASPPTTRPRTCCATNSAGRCGIPGEAGMEPELYGFWWNLSSYDAAGALPECSLSECLAGRIPYALTRRTSSLDQRKAYYRGGWPLSTPAASRSP